MNDILLMVGGTLGALLVEILYDKIFKPLGTKLFQRKSNSKVEFEEAVAEYSKSIDKVSYCLALSNYYSQDLASLGGLCALYIAIIVAADFLIVNEVIKIVLTMIGFFGYVYCFVVMILNRKKARFYKNVSIKAFSQVPN